MAAPQAQASAIGECFERVAVAVGHPYRAAPARVRVHKAVHRVHPKPRAAAPVRKAAVRPVASKVRYVMRPRACETHDAAPARLMSLQSAEPAVAASAPPEDLLTELAGVPSALDSGLPAAGLIPAGPVIPAEPVVTIVPDDEDFPFTSEPPPSLPGGGGGFVEVPPPTPPTGGPVGAVPEPSTWAMLLVGFFGLGAAVRRAKQSRHA